MKDTTLPHRSARRHRQAPLLILLALPWIVAASSSRPARRPAHRAAPVNLVWHVETLDGTEVSTIQGDEPINPASVVKVATTLWALEKLGPEHRFDTVFATQGALDAAKGTLAGDLIVLGNGDPDFHAENAFLVALRLNELGIRTVRGSLRVNDTFWIGWEGGTGRVITDPRIRAEQMAQRLRAALDPKRWNNMTRRAWREFAIRRGLPTARPPAVAVLGGIGALTRPPDARNVLLIHRSKGVADALRRFDCFSNNDIERLGASLGSASELAQRVSEVIGAPPDSVLLETISGLGTNRMTPRSVVQLLRALRTTCARLGLTVESLLPVAGCDPGTLNHSFARLGTGPNAMSVTAKTGTLTSTDGGTAVLAGFVSTGRGDLAFCVAAPHAGGRLSQARAAQARWLEQLIAAADGPRPRRCAGPLANPEDGAQIVRDEPSWTQSRGAAR